MEDLRTSLSKNALKFAEAKFKRWLQEFFLSTYPKNTNLKYCKTLTAEDTKKSTLLYEQGDRVCFVLRCALFYFALFCFLLRFTDCFVLLCDVFYFCALLYNTLCLTLCFVLLCVLFYLGLCFILGFVSLCYLLSSVLCFYFVTSFTLFCFELWFTLGFVLLCALTCFIYYICCIEFLNRKSVSELICLIHGN